MPPHESELRSPDWFRSVVFYELSIRSFYDSNGDGIGDLPGVRAKLDYLTDLGAGAVWLLPFYESPWRDDGYDISNHYHVDPRFGTVDDLDGLIADAHGRGLRLVADLVTNHVSDQHPWFQSARRDRHSSYRPWFLWSDSGTEFSRARRIFPDYEPSNWTFDEVAGQYYFHRFYATQPDLNYDTPAVHEEMFRFARFWLDHGFDGFRCDAAPYLYKREGTTCQSLPETHQFWRELRAMMDAEYPGTVLISEANQTIAETVAYFDRGREFPMVLHFPIMPNFYLGLAENNPKRILDLLRATVPSVPADGAWAYFLRNHDELSLEQASDEEKTLFFRYFPLPPGARVHNGVRRRLAPLLGGDDNSVLLLTALILGLPGSPFLYYGDEIGMGDRIDLPDRDAVRTPMQWEKGPSAGFSTAPPASLTRPLVTDPGFGPAARNVAQQEENTRSLLWRTRTLLRVRAAHAAVFGSNLYQAVDLGTAPVVGFWRPNAEYSVLCLYNFSIEPQSGSVPLPPAVWASPVELVRGGLTSTVADHTFQYRIAPRGFSWTLFLARHPAASVAAASPPA